jgi:D-arabinose 1-dehydrogenase-like Zn-dependent alcohol dehydrogenase
VRRESMRSVQVPEPGASLRLMEREVPEPAAGEVRVRVHACGVCRSDLYALAGAPGVPYPLTPGHEVSGVIDAVGPGVEGWELQAEVGVGWFGGQCGSCPSCRRGDFVTCQNMKAFGLMRHGGYAEYLVTPASALAQVPAGMDLTDVSPLMCAGVTAFNALRSARAQPGERVAIVGIGGLGHLAVQFAAKMGCEVIAVSRGHSKEEAALGLGAHHFVDALADSALADLGKLGGADVIIATSPNGSLVSALVSCANPRARVVITGFSDDDIRISPFILITRNVSVAGSAAGTSMDAEETLRFSLLHGIRPVVEPVPLEEYRTAYERMTSDTVRFRAVLTLGRGQPEAAAGPAEPSTQLLRGGLHPTGSSYPALDCPPGQPPDPEELITAAMQWHFGPQTGSAFWLERARTLDFDPRRDVRTYDDLRLFPNVSDELRHVRAADLIPKGYGPGHHLVGVYESGGTTGAPKKVVLLDDWLELWIGWALRVTELHRFPPGMNWLSVTPGGPHLLGHLGASHARRLGVAAFTVDMDPRWVKKLLSEGRADEADRYAEHILDQCQPILEEEEIGVLIVTPPLLERLARRKRLAEVVRQKVRLISWGGTHMDADTRRLYRTEIFPGAEVRGLYGNTMLLGGAAERPTAERPTLDEADEADEKACIFDPFVPYISFSVIDPATGENVPYGRRGRVLAHHVSKSMLLPNNLERDEATRVPSPSGPGDSVADVTPAVSLNEDGIQEGVY